MLGRNNCHERIALSLALLQAADWVDRATENGRNDLKGTLPAGVKLTDADLKDIRECQGCGQRHVF